MPSNENKYAYIPPAVQKSMAAHMERTMPAHLKQYQNSGAHMPARIEHEMTTQMQKNLPAHMQQYVEPFMHQNVIHGGGSSNQASQLRTSAPAAQAFKPVPTQVVLPHNNSSRRSLRQSTSQSSDDLANEPPATNSSTDGNYDFIMNPNQAPKKPLVDLSGASIFKRAIIVGAGVVILIMLASILFSFLNSASNAQQEKLLEIAQSQQEIVRVAESAQEKIKDPALLFRVNNVRLTVKSSQQEIITALTNRGLKQVDKKLSDGENGENDALLLEGEQNGRFDETYQALLDQQLSNYRLQLQAAHAGSNATEKQILETAFSQIELLLDEKPTEQ